MADPATATDTLGPLAAMLTALGGIVTVLWRMTDRTTSRVDRITASQIESLNQDRLRALTERDTAIEDRKAAEKEADKWAEKHQALAIQLARAEVEAEHYRRGHP